MRFTGRRARYPRRMVADRRHDEDQLSTRPGRHLPPSLFVRPLLSRQHVGPGNGEVEVASGDAGIEVGEPGVEVLRGDAERARELGDAGEEAGRAGALAAARATSRHTRATLARAQKLFVKASYSVGRWRNPDGAASAAGSLTTLSTRAIGGPWRQASIISAIMDSSPAKSASTLPSSRLRTQPLRPRRAASS